MSVSVDEIVAKYNQCMELEQNATGEEFSQLADEVRSATLNDSACNQIWNYNSSVQAALVEVYRRLHPQQQSDVDAGVDGGQQDPALDVKYEMYGYAVPCLVALCLLTVVANVWILLATRFIKSSLTPTLRLTLSLAAADAWAALILAVGLVVNSYLPYVAMVVLPNHVCIVLLFEAFRLGGILTTVLHLLALTVNHYLATEFPHTYSRYHSSNKLWLIIAALWIVPPLGYIVTICLIPNQAFNSVGCFENEFANQLSFRLVTVVLVLIPLLIMILFYIRIIRILAHMSKHATARSSTFAKRKMRTVSTALLFIGTFLIGWAPSTTLYLISCATCAYPVNDFARNNPVLLAAAGIFFNSLMILKSLINPLIYAVRIPEIKAALWLMHKYSLGVCFGARIQEDHVDPALVQRVGLLYRVIHMNNSSVFHSTTSTPAVSHRASPPRLSVRSQGGGSFYDYVHSRASSSGRLLSITSKRSHSKCSNGTHMSAFQTQQQSVDARV